MKSWLRNKPGTEMSNSWVVRGFILGAMPAPPEDFFLGRLLPDCRDDKNCPAEQQQPLLTLWHSIEKKIFIRNSLGRHFVGNQIWRKIWRYSKLPPFSWVEKLFSFQFVSVDCWKIYSGRYWIVNCQSGHKMSQEGTKRIQPRKQTLDEAYCPPGKWQTVQNTENFTRIFFSANYLEIILSDPKTYGENRSIFLKCIALHHSSLNSLPFTICNTL